MSERILPDDVNREFTGMTVTFRYLENGLRWSNPTMDIPAIGDRVRVIFNGFGIGTVRGYHQFGEDLFVRVQPDKYPEWYNQQHHGLRPIISASGAEIVALKEGEEVSTTSD